METQPTPTAMLELMLRPAFCVKGGKITQFNQAAASYLLSPGEDIAPLIAAGAEEYSAFRDGCLYLKLRLGGQTTGATVVAMEGCHLFLPEEPSSQEGLQALALAAMELREPLVGMATAVSRMPITNDTAFFNRRLHQMMRQVSNMSDAVSFSQSKGKMEYTQLCSFLEEQFSKAATLLQAAEITLKYSLPREEIDTLADPERLERAVYNLISNAAKHTQKGGVIEVTLSRNRGRVSLSIVNSGDTLAADILGNIYTRYLRAPGLASQTEGLGLGMVLARAVALQHGGTLLIDRPQGQNTRVTMTMAIRHRKESKLHSPVISPALRVDYAGERDHALQELVDVLPAQLYRHEH